jgi:thymidylate synthase
MSLVDHAYNELVNTVLNCGIRKENRTGIDTISYFGYHYNLPQTVEIYSRDRNSPDEYVSLTKQDAFPLLTGKEVSFKNILVELLWFLQGTKDAGFLEKHKCGFWRPWYKDVRGDKVVEAGYGYYWRKFPTIGIHFMAGDHELVQSDFDQLKFIVDELKRNKNSRRLVVSAWYPEDATKVGLPPCHVMYIFNTQYDEAGNPRLCLHLTQRSCDIALGVPYNIASYCLLLRIVAKIVGMAVGEFSHTLVDAHIYTAKANGDKAEFDHIPGLTRQITRDYRDSPQLSLPDTINGEPWSLESLNKFSSNATTKELLEVFKLENYNPHEKIDFKVAV